jgi:hypothetical protein
VVRCDFPDRKFADGGENHTLKHIQSPRLGDIGPVFHLQTLSGDGLKRVRSDTGLADFSNWRAKKKSTQLRGFIAFRIVGGSIKPHKTTEGFRR